MGLFEEEEINAEYERARKRAMYLLGGHAYSAAALREKLLNNYSQETADKVIDDMTEYGFLDDEEYAGKLAASLVGGKKYGLYRAKTEMRRKGVPEALIEEALSQYEHEDYVEQLKELIRKKYSDKIEDRDQRQKVIAALARRGFGFSEIKEAVLEVLEETLEEAEESEEED